MAFIILHSSTQWKICSENFPLFRKFSRELPYPHSTLTLPLFFSLTNQPTTFSLGPLSLTACFCILSVADRSTATAAYFVDRTHPFHLPYFFFCCVRRRKSWRAWVHIIQLLLLLPLACLHRQIKNGDLKIHFCSNF